MMRVGSRRFAGCVATALGVTLVAAPLTAQTPAQRPQPAPPAQPAGAPATPAAQVAAPTPQPVALPSLSPQHAALLTRTLREGAVAHGLVYEVPGERNLADNDALVRAVLDHARAVRIGRLDRSDFQSDWGLRPAEWDPLPSFAEAVRTNRIERWIADLPPPYAGYDGLKDGLVRYRQIAASGGWTTLAAGPDMGKGASGPRVAALRQRLAIEDAELPATGESFDDALEEAVKRAQRRYGLNPSGLVSTQTIAALNVPAERRVRQIMANMERWRWIPRELPRNRIQVNIAAALLTVFDGDTPVASMVTVTGKPGGSETPMLQSMIHSIVLNPPWNVPAGIAARELFPKGAAYLARNGFRVIGTGASRRLQQAAGPQSALGRYKFDFDNPYAVYLHDTPSQGAFNRFDRLASHGCVRVAQPAALAQYLLRADPAWQPDAIAAAVSTQQTQRVRLTEPMAVYLLYWTAFASSNGAMNFRSDPYRWDQVLATKIENRSAVVQRTAAR